MAITCINCPYRRENPKPRSKPGRNPFICYLYEHRKCKDVFWKCEYRINRKFKRSRKKRHSNRPSIKIEFVCLRCGKLFMAYESEERKYCSRRCNDAKNKPHIKNGFIRTGIVTTKLLKKKVKIYCAENDIKISDLVTKGLSEIVRSD